MDKQDYVELKGKNLNKFWTKKYLDGDKFTELDRVSMCEFKKRTAQSMGGNSKDRRRNKRWFAKMEKHYEKKENDATTR